MAKKKESVVKTETAPTKKPLSKLVYNRGTTPVVIKKGKDGPDVIQINRSRRFVTAQADDLLNRYKQLKEK